jgi:hypothetical protein
MLHPADLSNLAASTSQNNLSSAGYTHLIGHFSGETYFWPTPSTLMAEQLRLNDQSGK